MNIASDKPNTQSCLSHEAGRGEGEPHYIKYPICVCEFDPVMRLALVGKLLMSFCRLIAPRDRYALGINSW